MVYNMGCQSVGPQGDANQDSMTIYAADGSIATGSVTNFLSTLAWLKSRPSSGMREWLWRQINRRSPSKSA
jgi:hypothetical protein